MNGFYNLVKSEFGQRYIRHSCIADESTEKIFCDFLAQKPIKHALEIGTWFGTSAFVITHFAGKVSTIDIQWRPEPGLLWKTFKISNRIAKYERDSETQKAKIIDHLDFDFAFIDGGHRYDNVKLDFSLVKHCGRVLFHDYYDRTDIIPGIDLKEMAERREDPATLEEVKRFVDEIEEGTITIKKPFAYWEK